MTGSLHEEKYTFLIICRLVLLRLGNVSCKGVGEIKTHILLR